VNFYSKKDEFPLPRIDDCIDSLGGAKLFCTVDLQAGYWQVEMDPRDREKTAFVTRSGLYEWTVMPFGLCNAPSVFERLMETALRGLQW
jgi:putative transposase